MSDGANKVEKIKNKKGGQRMWTDVVELGELVRKGETNWEDLDLDEVDVRLKWAGLFHRRKKAPGTFMMRLKVGGISKNIDILVPQGERDRVT